MMRTKLCFTAVLLLAVLTCGLAAAEDGLPTEQLIYQGATVKTQIDVNGEAAVLLIGGMLDAAAEAVQKQAASAPQSGPMAQMAMAAPFIGPAKDAIKSLSRATVLVMSTDESIRAEEVMGYYSRLITPRAWSSMITVRAEDGANIAVYLAPGGKGVFAAIRPNSKELVVALVTTREPLGNLLAEIVRTGGSEALPAILAASHRPAAPAAEAQCAVAESPEAEETPEADETPEAE